MIGPFLTLIGAALTVLAALGVLRFPDVLARMHALAKASTLGYLLVCVGTAIDLTTANDRTTALLAAALQILTVPVGANLIGRATHLSDDVPSPVAGIDELADARRRTGQAVPPPSPTD